MTRRSWSVLIVAVALVTATAVVLTMLRARQRLGPPGVKVAAKPVHDPKGNVVGTNSIDLPEVVLNFSSEPMPLAYMMLDWLPKDTTYGARVYTASDGFQAAVMGVLMGSDRTSIHKPEYCLVGQGWKIHWEESEVTAIRIAQPHSYDLPVRKLIMSRTSQTENGQVPRMRGVFVYWLVANEQLQPYHNKIMGSIMKHMILTGELQRWAYMTCFATCPPGQEEATYERLKQLIAAAVPQFQTTVGPEIVEASESPADGVTSANRKS